MKGLIISLLKLDIRREVLASLQTDTVKNVGDVLLLRENITLRALINLRNPAIRHRGQGKD